MLDPFWQGRNFVFSPSAMKILQPLKGSPPIAMLRCGRSTIQANVTTIDMQLSLLMLPQTLLNSSNLCKGNLKAPVAGLTASWLGASMMEYLAGGLLLSGAFLHTCIFCSSRHDEHGRLCTVSASLISLAPPSAPCVRQWGSAAVYAALMMYENLFTTVPLQSAPPKRGH